MHRISRAMTALLILAVAGCISTRTTNDVVNIPRYTEPSDAKYDNLAYGVPGTVDMIIDREGFAIGFLKDKHQPAWVSYRLTRDECRIRLAARSNKFQFDPAVPLHSAHPYDYSNSGYDRGHMAPAADMVWSKRAMKNSFYMTNMSPQIPMFNRGIWRELETWVRDTAIKEGSIIVVSGTIFSTNQLVKTIGMTGVEVPDGYWKAILSESDPKKAIGFILPNEPSTNRISEFACSIDDIEYKVGIDLFNALPENEQMEIESKVELDKWQM